MPKVNSEFMQKLELQPRSHADCYPVSRAISTRQWGVFHQATLGRRGWLCAMSLESPQCRALRDWECQG